MKVFKLLATSLVLFFSLSVATLAADGDSHTLSYEKGGATFSAEFKDGKIQKLVRNKKVVYRSNRTIRQRSVKKQIKSLTRDIQQFISLDDSSGGQGKSLEGKIIEQMNKVTLRLSR